MGTSGSRGHRHPRGHDGEGVAGRHGGGGLLRPGLRLEVEATRFPEGPDGDVVREGEDSAVMSGYQLSISLTGETRRRRAATRMRVPDESPSC